MIDMKSRTACFTGHRELPTDDLPEISKRVEDTLATLIEQGYRYFGAGGALGFDTLAAQVVLRLRERYPQIRLILVLPCLNQTRGWPQADIDTYEEIKRCADKVTYTSEHYFRGCMQKRNRHLVDNSSVCICYLTKPTGGTAYTVNYASEHGTMMRRSGTKERARLISSSPVISGMLISVIIISGCSLWISSRA